jgi:hypothetical protein
MPKRQSINGLISERKKFAAKRKTFDFIRARDESFTFERGMGFADSWGVVVFGELRNCGLVDGLMMNEGFLEGIF